MTNVEGRPIRLHKRLLSSDRVVFLVVSVTIIGVIVETGITRVSGFVNMRDLIPEIAIFVGLGIFCIFSQLIILNFVSKRVGKSFFFHNRRHIGVINKAIVIIQVGIIVLLVAVLLEASLTFSYHTILIKAIIMSSFLTAAALTGILSWQFIIWIKSNKNRLILSYLVANLFMYIYTVTSAIAFVLLWVGAVFL